MNRSPRHRTARRAQATLRVGLLLAGLGSLGWGVILRPDKEVETANGLLGRGKAKEALSRYQKAEKRLGRRPRLDYNQGLAHYLLSHLKKAQDAFLSAVGSGDAELRRRAFFGLANTLYRLAEPIRAEAKKLSDQLDAGQQKLASLDQAGAAADGPKKAQRCKAIQALAQLAEQSAKAWRSSAGAFRKAYQEYRRLLEKSPAFFDAKWNLELALRQMQDAERRAKQADRAQAALGARFKKECEAEKKKKDQKQNQQKKQDKQKKQNQQKKQDRQKKQREQKPLTKEDIARQRAARELDKLERRQRQRDRQRARRAAGRQPLKDW